jgi:TolA-binding protein
LAEAKYADKKYADAAKLYQKALDAASAAQAEARLKDKVLYRLGWCRWAEGKLDQSADLFDRLVAETPASDLAPEALLQAGEAYARLGKMPEAVERLAKLADAKYKDFPRLADARFRLGEAQLALGRTEDALATFVALERASPDYPAMAEVQFDLGKALYDLGRLPEARERFERAVSMTDTETGAKAQFYVGEALLAAGEPREALRAYLRVVSPLWSAYKDWAAAAQFEIGKCYLSLKQPADARAAFQAVLDRYGDTKWAQPAREQLAKMPG